MLRRFAVETGKALRETGQALERTGMRVAGDESFVDSWSRHRPLMGVHNWMTHVAPEVAGTAWVAPSASVIGDVSLGAGASVFYGAIVRGDRAAVTIGKGTNVQDQAILTTGTSLGTPKRDATTPLTIGENVTIGHGASIQSCTIGDESLVGMGAVLMEGCVVESNGACWGSCVGFFCLLPLTPPPPPLSLSLQRWSPPAPWLPRARLWPRASCGQGSRPHTYETSPRRKSRA